MTTLVDKLIQNIYNISKTSMKATEDIEMFFVRRRKLSISNVTALVAVLTLAATEAYAGNGVIHVIDSVFLPN